MNPKPVLSYASRFVLPLVLLAAALGAWFVANQLGSVDRATTTSESTDSPEVPLASVRRLPGFTSATRQDEAISTALASLPDDPGGRSCTSILVDGQPVLTQRSDLALVPSYAQLLITGHAALEILGPDFRYETRVLAQALPDGEGRIGNGLYVIGGGDPVLMTRDYAQSFRPTLATRTPIEKLAAAVAEAGVVRIEGGVIAVDRRYDEERILPGWPDEYTTAGLIGPLTAFQVDDAFEVRASVNQGIAVGSETPSQFGAFRFVDILDEIGIEANGFHRALFPDEQVPDLVPIARVQSAPLSEIVLQMFAVNDATAAELILKEIGVAESDNGTTQAGGRAVQRVIQGQGVDVPVPFRDGSGLDPIGGTSCGQLVTVVDTIPDDHPTLASLPAYDLPGVYGGAFADAAVETDLRLIGGIQGDAGGFVARTAPGSGRRITLVSIINRPGGPTAADTSYQQALIELVDDLQQAITVEDLGLDD